MELEQYRRTVRLLESLDSKDKNMFTNIISDLVDRTDLMDNVLDILRDDSVYSLTLQDRQREALTRLLLRYSRAYISLFLSGVRIDGLLKYTQTKIYHVNAVNGYRIATKSEVEQAVASLMAEVTDNIPEKEQRLLKLFQWTLDGDRKLFKSLGYELEFSEDRKLKTSYFQMLVMAGNELNELMDFMEDEKRFESCVAKLKKIKRKGKYKYPEYAVDEIQSEMTIKQLVYKLKPLLPIGSSNPDIRRALHLILTWERDTKLQNNADPLDIAMMRRVYASLSGQTDTIYNQTVEDDSQLNREKCERLLKAKRAGEISQSDFVFKIISTLKKSNYKKVSPKQLAIIDTALEKLDKNLKESKENLEREKFVQSKLDKSTIDIFDMATVLGDGLIGEL